MTLSLVTAPAAPVVTLAQAKAHLAVTHALDDDAIQLYLDAAIAHVDGAEGTLGRCLVTQTWDYTLDAFTSTIKVPLPTLQSVTSVSYVDTDGNTQTVDPGDYIVAGQRIVAGNAGWPSTDNVPDAVTVRFVAGYATADDVPAAIKSAILLLVGGMYANRESEGAALVENPAVQRLLAPYKVLRV